MANPKYAFFKSIQKNQVQELRSSLTTLYIDKYYNTWMSKYDIEGLDEELKDKQENFILRKFWSVGKVGCFKISNLEMLGFADFAENSTYDMYDFPTLIRFLNPRNAPQVPIDELTNGFDCAVGWAMPSRKSIESVVKVYVRKLVEIELVLNTNLTLQNIPFVIACSDKDKAKMNDIVTKIINNEPVIYTSLQDVKNVQVLASQMPFIIDKLTDYKRTVESELLTFLGVDNNGSKSLEQTHITSDAVNANNEEINNNDGCFEKEIGKFFDNIKKVFGRELKLISKSSPAVSVHEEQEGEGEEEGEEENE